MCCVASPDLPAFLHYYLDVDNESTEPTAGATGGDIVDDASSNDGNLILKHCANMHYLNY